MGSKPAWESRWHPLRREWVLMAAHRQNRPWSGNRTGLSVQEPEEYVADCYLCPGNRRISDILNPQYNGIFVFENDHPCVSTEAPSDISSPPGIYRNQPARGIAKVVCYHPRHDRSLATMEPHEVVNLVSVWQEEYAALVDKPEVKHVLIFENRGEAVGVSNPHPHCQIYATNFIFKYIEEEVAASVDHFESTGRLLFQDILKAESERQLGVIAENEQAIAFVPYFARYAYEVYVAPKTTRSSLAEMTDSELEAFAEILQQVAIRYDNLWEMPFPYVLALHNAPTDGGDYSTFHFHAEFYPPLRKPDLLKYLAGPEIGGGNFLSDTDPDDKAAELRSVSTTHYSKSAS